MLQEELESLKHQAKEDMRGIAVEKTWYIILCGAIASVVLFCLWSSWSGNLSVALAVTSIPVVMTIVSVIVMHHMAFKNLSDR